MPTYDYHCDRCTQDFTAMHKMSDPAPACPACGGEVKKKVSAPALLGSGVTNDKAATAAPAHGCAAGACGCRH